MRGDDVVVNLGCMMEWGGGGKKSRREQERRSFRYFTAIFSALKGMFSYTEPGFEPFVSVGLSILE